ncbi:hypothetical protein OSB04_025158 [Centaurea solstitialis]|uniref:Chromo domain-containing protein n=1 Tax=Centaurea solstitialis TaxID=347529 RepID=A0AA38WEK0_9ASTR|nr:hypothetical protein OSB04_025158 [Centaurea solstitialis]
MMLNVSPLKDLMRFGKRVELHRGTGYDFDKQVQQLRNKEITLVKVQWKFHKGQHATWESEDEMKEKYPICLLKSGIPGTEFF